MRFFTKNPDGYAELFITQRLICNSLLLPYEARHETAQLPRKRVPHVLDITSISCCKSRNQLTGMDLLKIVTVENGLAFRAEIILTSERN